MQKIRLRMRIDSIAPGCYRQCHRPVRNCRCWSAKLVRPARPPSSAAAESSAPSMSSRPTLDRESFQQLLATAFAVQGSRGDRQSLSANVELQGLIAKGELDGAGVMHLIVDRARNVAHATG